MSDHSMIPNPNIGRPDRLPVGQHKSKNWPVLHIDGPQAVDLSTWTLKLSGEVDNPLTLSWEELSALPCIDVQADFHCVTTWSVFDSVWTGIPFSHIAKLAQVQAGVSFVRMMAESGFDSSLPLDVMMDEDVLLCTHWNGNPLTPDHGYPLRTLVPKKYGWKSVKWLRELQFLSADHLGFWEERGYSNTADPWTNDRFSS